MIIYLISKNNYLQKWRINGSDLYVTKSEHSIVDRNHKRSYDKNEVKSAQIANSRMNNETPYQLYKKNANSFWADIPHHEARIKHKKDKMKYVDITKRTFLAYKANGCNNNRKVQKWKKKASKIDHKSTKDYYSSLNLVRQVTSFLL